MFGMMRFPFIKEARAEDDWYVRILGSMADAGKSAGYPIDTPVRETGLEAIISNVIKILLSFIGALFLILTIRGGYQWMTAGGNDDAVGEAKKRIINGLLGMLVILIAYLITDFVLGLVIAATGV